MPLLVIFQDVSLRIWVGNYNDGEYETSPIPPPAQQDSKEGLGPSRSEGQAKGTTEIQLSTGNSPLTCSSDKSGNRRSGKQGKLRSEEESRAYRRTDRGRDGQVSVPLPMPWLMMRSAATTIHSPAPTG